MLLITSAATVWAVGLCAVLFGAVATTASAKGAAPIAAGAKPSVEYTIRIDQPQTQMIDVDLTLRGAVIDQATGGVDVMLPVWRPGRYQILDLAGGVQDVTASAGSDRPLPIEQIDKATWRITPESGKALPAEFRVSYRLYCNSIADRTRHVDDTHAFLSPSAVLMYHPPFRDRQAIVNLQGPSRWRVACGLENDGDARRLLAPNYDVLVDSPIEWGVHDFIEFDVDGVPHQIAIWEGATRIAKYDAEKLKRDFAKIVRSQRDIFQHTPYSRYIFLLHCYATGGGGTEHLNSTIMGCTPAAFDTPEAYRKLLGLVSHEMFHTWNVKQLRPSGLVPYDYQRENYTRLLWVAEGTTSYYDDLILARTKLMKPDDYLGVIGAMIESLRLRPGDAVQSAEASSFDAWTKFNKATADSANSTVSFYDKGALVSCILDLDVRLRTKGQKSMDDVMRILYQRFPLNKGGFNTQHVLDVLAEVTGASPSVYMDFYTRHIAGTEPMATEERLAFVGLELVDPDADKEKDKEKDKADADKPASADADADKEPKKDKLWLGCTLDFKDGVATVATVSKSGPAYAAGLLPTDVVIAVNGQRVKSADLGSILTRVAAHDRVRLSVFRYDVLREIEVQALPEPKRRKLQRVKSPTDDQKLQYQRWVGREWGDK